MIICLFQFNHKGVVNQHSKERAINSVHIVAMCISNKFGSKFNAKFLFHYRHSTIFAVLKSKNEGALYGTINTAFRWILCQI